MLNRKGLHDLVERHAPDPADESAPEEEELAAGYEELGDRFGPLLGLDAAASSNVLNYPKVLETDADTILAKLQLESARAAYQRRLQKIYHAKTA